MEKSSKSPENKIQTEQMAVGYGSRPLISEIALQVRTGQIVTLIGPNGAGKSTILKSVIGQLPLLGGVVYLDGRKMSIMSASETAKKMAVMMTQKVRPEQMTCRDVVEAGRYPYTGRFGILTQADRQKVLEAMELVHAKDLADREFARISDGQRQRVLLARAIAQEPEILVLDEPTSYLDVSHKLELLALLKALVKSRGIAVLMSLHELDLAERISDYIVCVGQERIERCGTPEEIFTDQNITQLYQIQRGTFCAQTGTVELERPEGDGTPEIFVIGGGGSAISLYRRLQRQNLPFFAGVIAENDVEYPIARALSANLIFSPAFEPIGDSEFAQAVECLKTCRRVFCTVERFGTMNHRNQELKDLAQSLGILEDF